MLTIKIDTGNAAFEGENWGPEIARILRLYADDLELGREDRASMSFPCPMRDINGNVVGQATLTTDGEEE